MRLLALGDVVGPVGVAAVERGLPALKREYRPDLILINAENSAAGNGVDRRAAEALFAAGADVLTGGNHSFQKKEAHALHEETPALLRPANWEGNTFGHGEYRLDCGSFDLRVISLQGTLFMNACANPFQALEALLQSGTPRDLTVVDFHAEATAEKLAMGWHFDGRVALLFGSHTHVQTADERILPGGTGYLTDIGMCGAQNGILGKALAPCIHNFIDPAHRVPIADAPPPARLCGICATLDEKSGKCTEIMRFQKEID